MTYNLNILDQYAVPSGHGCDDLGTLVRCSGFLFPSAAVAAEAPVPRDCILRILVGEVTKYCAQNSS